MDQQIMDVEIIYSNFKHHLHRHHPHLITSPGHFKHFQELIRHASGMHLACILACIRHQMWVEFVSSLLCSERFSPGTPVSPLLKKNQLLT